MIAFLLLYLMLLKFIENNSLYLTRLQYNSIINLIKNPLTNSMEREKINLILYSAYEKWAIKKSLEFKKKHQYKCRDINQEELILSGKMGLFKSIRKYNGKYNFIVYSSIYIKGELLKLLTDHYALSILPKSYRKTNKTNLTTVERNTYKKLLTTNVVSSQIDNNYQLINESQHWYFDKHNRILQEKIVDNLIEREKTNAIWNKINSLNPITRQIYHLKFDAEFNKIRSNKEVAELMCYSEENVRKRINKSRELIIKQMVNI